MENQVPSDIGDRRSDQSVEPVSHQLPRGLLRFFESGEMAQELRPERLVQSSSEAYGQSLQGLARKIATTVRRHSNGSSRWLGDIYPSIGLEEAEDLAEQAKEWEREYGVIAIIWHPERHETRFVRRRDPIGTRMLGRRDRAESTTATEESDSEETCSSDDSRASLRETIKGHAHIYHTCPWKGSSCRCRFLRGVRCKRRHGRRVVYGRHINSQHIRQWLEYFMRPPRKFLHLALAKVSALPEIDQIRNLRQSQEMEESSADEEMEGGVFPGDNFDWRSIVSQRQSYATSSTTEDGASQTSEIVPGSSFKPSRTLQQRVDCHVRLVNALNEFLCVPVYSTCELQQWIENPVLSFFDKADPDYKRAVSTVARRLQFLTFDQIWELVENAQSPMWYARTPDHYMSVEESIKIVRSLLLYQYGSRDTVREFLHRLYNVCERVEPKRNSMFVSGPPNCGKTWFFDMVCAYYLNVGHVANFVRGEHFPLNDCVGRRILMWNEPNLMLSAFDTIKMVAGGDPCPANVKYQGHSVISRTPLLLTGNRAGVFPTTEVWNSRMYRESWMQCPDLKKVIGYPNPKAYYYLMKEFKIPPY